MLKNKFIRRRIRIPSKKVPKELHLYQFPTVEGFKEISLLLNSNPAENMFGALLHAFPLSLIKDEKNALKAERMLEYLGLAFDQLPKEIESYQHILIMLLDEYDKTRYVSAAADMKPHEFLKALLKEDNIPQKSLVPDCFHSQSQVSEYLNQKEGRQRLSAEQIVALGKKFKVDPFSFL